MDKISDEELFLAILASHILDSYLAQDPHLAELMKATKHPDIHYYEGYTRANQIGPALKRRLEHMISRNIRHNLEATKQLVAFSETHPDSDIYNVTFNCPTQHYGVRLGRSGHQLHVICVMTGGHIPDVLLGASDK